MSGGCFHYRPGPGESDIFVNLERLDARKCNFGLVKRFPGQRIFFAFCREFCCVGYSCILLLTILTGCCTGTWQVGQGSMGNRQLEEFRLLLSGEKKFTFLCIL